MSDRLELNIVDEHLELQQLRRWKDEALAVLNEWEQVWEALGRPGQLGESKAAAVLQHVRTTHATKPPNIDEVNP